MFLENLVRDARGPRRLGHFWRVALACTGLTDEPDLYEARLQQDDGPWLDLCFQQVDEPDVEHPRLHLDLLGGAAQQDVVARLLALGARHVDIGQHEGDGVPWVVLADPEGMPFCVMEERAEYADTGPVAALPLDVVDPERAGAMWRELTGWVETPGHAPVGLRHPSGRGPLLELCAEPEAAGAGVKNAWHLDVRLEPGDDLARCVDVVRQYGGELVEHEWGDDLPWTVLQDDSGNPLCLLHARS